MRTEFWRTLTVVTAIQEAAKIIKEGGSFQATSDMLKKYRNSLFPDMATELEDAAKKTQELLAKEFEAGPMVVQALDYGRRKKKGR